MHKCNKMAFGAKALAVIAIAIVHGSGFVSAEVELTVLHTNDVHSRFLQTDKFGGSCPEDQVNENKCYGGFARLHYKVGHFFARLFFFEVGITGIFTFHEKVKEIRASHKNVVYLSGGDYYQGTVWYRL